MSQNPSSKTKKKAGAGEIIARRKIMIKARTGTSGTMPSTRKRFKRRTRRRS